MHNKFKTTFESVLSELNLNYEKIINTEDENENLETYILGFSFGHIKEINLDYRFDLFIYLDSNINTLSFVVDEVLSLPIEHQDNISLYKLLNLLNASTIFGNVFCNESDNNLVIKYSHSVPVYIDKKDIEEKFSNTLSYVTFFIKEILINFYQSFENIGVSENVKKLDIK